MGMKKMEIPRHISTFAAGTETIIGLGMSRDLCGLWGFSFLNNDMRLFLFKLHSGLLGLNNRVAHFVHGHSPICTFCRIQRRGDAPDESVLHLFYDCPYTENVRDEFFRWFYNKGIEFSISRKDLFLVQYENDMVSGTSIVKTLLAKFFLKYIWECKTRETLPDLDSAKILASSYFNNISNVSLRMRDNIIDSGLSLRILQG
jgi:hypothetical protein